MQTFLEYVEQKYEAISVIAPPRGDEYKRLKKLYKPEEFWSKTEKQIKDLEALAKKEGFYFGEDKRRNPEYNLYERILDDDAGDKFVISYYKNSALRTKGYPYVSFVCKVACYGPGGWESLYRMSDDFWHFRGGQVYSDAKNIAAKSNIMELFLYTRAYEQCKFTMAMLDAEYRQQLTVVKQYFASFYD